MHDSIRSGRWPAPSVETDAQTAATGSANSAANSSTGHSGPGTSCFSRATTRPPSTRAGKSCSGRTKSWLSARLIAAFSSRLRHRVVARRLRLVGERLVPRLDDLVLDVVDDVAADAGGALGGLDEDVHRAFRVAAGGLADDPVVDLVRAGELEVEEPQRAGRVQTVDVVLHVLGRVLRAHQAGDRVLELAAVHHDRRRHREAVVLAGMVDVAVRVQHGGDVARSRRRARRARSRAACPRRRGPVMPSRSMISGLARAGVDEDRPGRVAEDQDAPRVHPDAACPCCGRARGSSTRRSTSISERSGSRAPPRRDSYAASTGKSMRD